MSFLALERVNILAILKIRDAQGNVQEILAIKGNDGKDGKDYVLTDSDKQEIAEMAVELIKSNSTMGEDAS